VISLLFALSNSLELAFTHTPTHLAVSFSFFCDKYCCCCRDRKLFPLRRSCSPSCTQTVIYITLPVQARHLAVCKAFTFTAYSLLANNLTSSAPVWPTTFRIAFTMDTGADLVQPSPSDQTDASSPMLPPGLSSSPEQMHVESPSKLSVYAQSRRTIVELNARDQEVILVTLLVKERYSLRVLLSVRQLEELSPCGSFCIYCVHARAGVCVILLASLLICFVCMCVPFAFPWLLLYFCISLLCFFCVQVSDRRLRRITQRSSCW
jgi:hypothetical protein